MMSSPESSVASPMHYDADRSLESPNKSVASPGGGSGSGKFLAKLREAVPRYMQGTMRSELYQVLQCHICKALCGQKCARYCNAVKRILSVGPACQIFSAPGPSQTLA
jgi:hypothetical protein